MGAAQEEIEGDEKNKTAPDEKKETSPQEIKEIEALLEELNKPSKGSELIEKLSKEKEDMYASFIKDGVEVVDVKAIPKEPEKEEPKHRKWGLPENKNRKTWDKI